MSPHVTWSVRSSAKYSLRTAAARRKFILGLNPAVSVYSLVFFTLSTPPRMIIWICLSWCNPHKARKIVYFKSFFSLYASAHGYERLGLRHAARAVKEVLYYNSCRITDFSTIITGLCIVVHMENVLNPTEASCSGAPSTRRTWSCWSGSRGGHKDGPRAGAPLL